MTIPNFNDKRVRKRVKQGLGWACAQLNTGERGLAQSYIDDAFGYHTNPVSKWLRATLLTVVVPHSHLENRAAIYRLNIAGVKYCRRLLKESSRKNSVQKIIRKETVDWAVNTHGSSIESGDFLYNESSNRLWNSLQNIATIVRDPLFASYGYVHSYDIEAAAPTIVVQYARLMGYSKATPNIDDYLNNKTRRRNQLAARLHVPPKISKSIIAALFMGASRGSAGSIARDITSNRLVLARLGNDSWCKSLIKEVNSVFKFLGASKSKDKMAVYLKQERAVMSAVIKYLKRQRQISNRPVRYFLEHDGWRSDTPVDLYALTLWVNNHTDYNIKFKEEILEENQL